MSNLKGVLVLIAWCVGMQPSRLCRAQSVSIKELIQLSKCTSYTCAVNYLTDHGFHYLKTTGSGAQAKYLYTSESRYRVNLATGSNDTAPFIVGFAVADKRVNYVTYVPDTKGADTIWRQMRKLGFRSIPVTKVATTNTPTVFYTSAAFPDIWIGIIAREKYRRRPWEAPTYYSIQIIRK